MKKNIYTRLKKLFHLEHHYKANIGTFVFREKVLFKIIKKKFLQNIVGSLRI